MNIPKLGDIVAGRYELTGELGRGGFGVVFKAIQTGMNRPVALKVLLPQAASEDTMVERFVREAQLAKNLVHPNTIQLFDFGETDGGCLYIAMEYLEGETLDQLIKREGQLPMERTIHIAAQILKSLAEAHEHNIIHRDLKPANIFMRELVGEKDFVKVLDFGIAKALNLDGAEEEQQLTKTGSSFGTPSYMSPEQIRGLHIGPHTDIYALGLIMLKSLTGATAVEGGTPIETAAMQLSANPIPLPDWVAQSPLGPVLAKALAKDLKARYASAADMLHDLQAVSASARSGVMPVIAPGNTGMVAGGPTPPSGQFVYSGQFDYNQLSGPVPIPPGAQSQKSSLVPILIAVILLLLVGGAATAYLLVTDNGGKEGQAQAQTPDKAEPETPPVDEPPATDGVEPVDTAAVDPTTDANLDALGDALQAELDEPDPEMVEVPISSEPAGALVREGNTVLGATPMTASFEKGSGKHTITISGFGFEDSTLEIDADADEVEPVTVALVAKDDGKTTADSGEPTESTASSRDADAGEDEPRSSRRRRRDRDKDTKDTETRTQKDDKKDDKKDTGGSTKPSIPMPD